MSTTATPLSPPPGPRALPIVGNLPWIVRHGPVDYFMKQWALHGDHFVVWFGNRRTHVLAHPDAAQQILSTRRQKYVKGRSYDDFRNLTGAGMLTLEGNAWKRRRRLAQPSFHRESIARLVETFVRCTEDAVDRWRREMPQGGVFDMHHEMMRLTLEIVGETLFGQPLGDGADDSSQAFASALEALSARGNSPIKLPMAIPTPANRRFQRALSDLDETVYKVIDHAQAHPDEETPTLLGMLLAARDADTGEALTREELRDEVITLFLAGHETTALTMSWAVDLFRRFPEAEARVHEEVARVLEGRRPDAASLRQLEVTDRTVKEILRLRSPVWALARDCAEEDEINGHIIRPGDVVMPIPYLSHRHPEFWPDAETFDADRFLQANVKERHRYAWYPFSAGPRMCIGNIFALVETQALLAVLSQTCRLKLLEDAPPGIAQITFRPATAMNVQLTWNDQQPPA